MIIDDIMTSALFWMLYFIFGVVLMTIKLFPKNDLTMFIFNNRRALTMLMLFVGAFGAGYTSQYGLMNTILDWVMNINPYLGVAYVAIWLLFGIWIKVRLKINKQKQFTALSLTVFGFLLGIMASAVVTITSILA